MVISHLYVIKGRRVLFFGLAKVVNMFALLFVLYAEAFGAKSAKGIA